MPLGRPLWFTLREKRLSLYHGSNVPITTSVHGLERRPNNVMEDDPVNGTGVPTILRGNPCGDIQTSLTLGSVSDSSLFSLFEVVRNVP